MGSIKKVAFYTLGCKVNQYETESIKKQFIEMGYVDGNFEERADVYVINSCTVTNLADRKTRNMLRRAKSLNPDSIVVATGCYAQTNADDVAKIEEVDYIIGNTDKDKIAYIVENREKREVEDIFQEKEYLETGFSTLREMTRAYIKIQDGCNNFCSYCKIPFARGNKRSRSIESIIEEVKTLAKEGYKEIILIGINLGAYGEDIKEKKISLEDVMEESSKIDGIERVRIGSIYPDKISERMINLIEKNSKIMPHLHISLQSGDDEILKMMKRKYNSELVRDVLAELRKRVKNIEFTADIITGFPGEKESNYKSGYNLIKEVEFSGVHIFQYSDRENTEASKFEGKIKPQIKKERAKELEKLSEEIAVKRREIYKGKIEKVLIEEGKEKEYYGYTENYLRVKVLREKIEVNTIIDVKINKIEKGLLTGE
jgi:threonylcarbamoyladenosine tRNA methylthiotransferase MtaB